MAGAIPSARAAADRLPRATTWWALDSGGFTELSRYGTWATGPTPAAYAARIRRYRDEIRLVAPGLYLGLMYDRSGPALTMYFALETL